MGSWFSFFRAKPNRAARREEQLAVAGQARQEQAVALAELRVKRRSLEVAINELVMTNKDRRDDLRAD